MSEFSVLPIEPMLKKRVISNNNVTVLKGQGKGTLAEVNCYCKITSVMALDDVTSLLCMKVVTNTCKLMRHSPAIGRISSVKIGRS